MSETSRRVLAALSRPPYDPHGPNGSWDTSAMLLAREVNALELSRGNDGLWCANVGEHDSIKAKLAEAERKVAGVRTLVALGGHTAAYDLRADLLAILDGKGE